MWSGITATDGKSEQSQSGLLLFNAGAFHTERFLYGAIGQPPRPASTSLIEGGNLGSAVNTNVTRYVNRAPTCRRTENCDRRSTLFA